MNQHHESTGPADAQQITLRSPADLADALPYLMGFHPTDSVVMVALHGRRGRFGGRLRLGIPGSAQEWPDVAEQLADSLISGSERRGSRPDAVVVFLCQDPAREGGARHTVERLRPLAQLLRTACGALDVPVLEALCISGGRYWSYCCPDARCCPDEGNPLALPGTTVMAAAAAYVGIQVRGSLRDMEARLAPHTGPGAQAQRRALDTAAAALVARILDARGRVGVADETLALARVLRDRLGSTPTPVAVEEADARDDRLIEDGEAAAVILGLQDRDTRDRAAQWMEGAEAPRALRLWRALARRCVGPYVEHAAAPLTLAGWVSWSTGDEPGARVALALALRSDPQYTFALLLHQACNEGLDPETLRRCLRGDDDMPPGPPGDTPAVAAAGATDGPALSPAPPAPVGGAPRRTPAKAPRTAPSRGARRLPDPGGARTPRGSGRPGTRPEAGGRSGGPGRDRISAPRVPRQRRSGGGVGASPDGMTS
ncbi:DUF4192 domain-containing protein [uncultured Streptomyces sp.]|uniref:DUF4192 domain-containing protein n=1 Tax=uncultured Streptomyces sp. TaxID=174707 RepID=UPI002618ABEB|nr:DUF4192 domain-containing protein [uncultured Streptomyces sp.]